MKLKSLVPVTILCFCIIVATVLAISCNKERPASARGARDKNNEYQTLSGSTVAPGSKLVLRNDHTKQVAHVVENGRIVFDIGDHLPAFQYKNTNYTVNLKGLVDELNTDYVTYVQFSATGDNEAIPVFSSATLLDIINPDGSVVAPPEEIEPYSTTHTCAGNPCFACSFLKSPKGKIAGCKCADYTGACNHTMTTTQLSLADYFESWVYSQIAF